MIIFLSVVMVFPIVVFESYVTFWVLPLYDFIICLLAFYCVKLYKRDVELVIDMI